MERLLGELGDRQRDHIPWRQDVLIAFSIDLSRSPDGPESVAWQNGYAIVMTFDDEWPCRFIALAPPSVFQTFAKNNLSQFNIELGFSHLSLRSDYEQLLANGAQWASVFPHDRWESMVQSEIGLIFHVEELTDFDTWNLTTIERSRPIILAVRGDSLFNQHETIEQCKCMMAAWMERVPQVVPKLLVCTSTLGESEEDYSQLLEFINGLPGVDGVFFENVYPGYVAEVCQRLYPREWGS